ncbi:hypothetical protein ABEX25_01280 [Paenibacillus thiaminolyticus]|uniref:hypothetical protein n=1 Tax=Paenibacillus thiaminolyticus TaxID=49283 RepID=UPI003D29CF8E
MAKNDNQELTFSERTARLVLVISVLSALFILYWKALFFFLDTVSKKAYLPSLISYEHIIISCMLSSGLLILIFAVYYCFSEFSALNKRSDDRSNKADENYDLLFKLFEMCLYLTVISLYSFVLLFHYLIGNYIISIFFSFPLLLFLPLLIFKKTRKIVHNFVSSLLKFTYKNWRKILVWFTLSALILFFLLIKMTYNQNSFFSIKFSNNTDASIKFHFTNTIPEQIELVYYSVNQHDVVTKTTTFIINKQDFRRSSIEVFGKDEENSEPTLINRINDEITKGTRDTYFISKSLYEYNFEHSSSKYLSEGKNIIVINFYKPYISYNQHYQIINEVHLDKGKHLTINKSEFSGNL